MGEEEKAAMGHFQAKKLESWEEQVLHQPPNGGGVVEVKQENSASSFVYGHANEDFQAKPTWSHHHQVMPVSSPKSCVTTFSSNMLDFSTNNKSDGRHPPPDRSSEVKKHTFPPDLSNPIYIYTDIQCFHKSHASYIL